MKTPLLISTLLTATLMANLSYADDDCHDSITDWQPKNVLHQQLENEGWQVQRIKVDDGCYKVKGLDQNGNKVKAEYYPASLRLDRKSTRLNSSHVRISYAVFCLKKKTY